MTGIRLWMGSISAFGVVVMIVAVTSSPSGPAQVETSPAKMNSPSAGLLEFRLAIRPETRDV